ncbi:hypothetical protein JXJ21_07670 [candidate division KSB1 bacterium]|nr:hypothetical protein [candidate division KSB1 bacterium]
MILKEDVPQPFLDVIQKYTSEVDLLISIGSDLTRDGSFGEQWLIFMDRTISVYARTNGAISQEKNISIEVLTKIEAQSLVGSGVLEATTRDGELVELIRYSNVHTTKFTAAARYLNQIAKGEDPKPVTDEEPVRCAKCNMLLPKGTNVCPRCIQKRKAIIRLVSYLKPYWVLAASIGGIMLIRTAFHLVPPYFTKILIDRVLNSTNYALLGWIILAFAGMRIIGSALQIAIGRMTASLGFGITYNLRAQLFEKIQSMPL